jgi:SSS family solute:Na+ symporter/sodium/proline symporter
MASIAYLDLVIGGLVTIMVVIAVPLLLNDAGGWAGVRNALPADHFTVFGAVGPERALGTLIPTMLLLVGNQGMYQKFFSARSEKDANRAVAGWIIGTLLLETLLIMVAVIGSAKFKTEAPREIIPLTARQGLPTLIGAILLGGIFAKVISTANNYLFSPATNLIHDVYERFINRKSTERQSLIVSRLLVIGLGVFALLQAARFESILNASLYAYTIYGAAVTPVVLAVFFWKRANAAGAIASIALGTVVTIAWNLAPASFTHEVDAVYPALIASVVSLILVSLLTSKPEEAKWKPFFE